MVKDQNRESSPAANDMALVYEAPKVESVLSANDLEREVMHGIVSMD